MVSTFSGVRITVICMVEGEGEESEVESQRKVDNFGNSFCVVWVNTISRVTVCKE